MFNFDFNLKKDKTDKLGLSPVILTITYNSNRFRINIPEAKANILVWNDKKKRLLRNTKDIGSLDSERINLLLSEIEVNITKYRNEVVHNKVNLKFEVLKKDVYQIVNGDSNSNKFFQNFEEFIEARKISSSERTITGFITCLNKIKEFEKYYGRELTYDEIDFEFFDQFKKYMFEVNNYRDNYFSKIISNVKTYLTWSNERGYHNKLIFKKFSAPEKVPEIVALSNEEFLKLYQTAMPNKKLEKVKDVFCFACATGLRYSDLVTLKEENIIGDYIKKSVIKTREIIEIPLNNIAKDILNKYSFYAGGVLPVISGQKYNDYIKECCKIAEINQSFSFTTFVSGRPFEIIKPKCEFITSHTARKTFTTLSLFLGMSETAVKQITGHKKQENFNRYIKFSNQQKKTEMQNAWNKLV